MANVSGEEAKAESKPQAPAEANAKTEEMPVEQTVEQLAAKVRPAVVVISVTGRDGKPQGIGSGFLISPDGLIATNQHVIGDHRPIQVQLADGRNYPVTTIVATQRAVDLALIKIVGKDLPTLSLGDPGTLKQGQEVIAFGNPHGLKHSVVAGVVSGKREIDGREMIQLAMPIEPGNSGGPLLDMQGKVHGVITMKSLVTPNLGFAVTINALRPLMDKPQPIEMSKWLTIGALDPKDWTALFGARWRQRAGRIVVDGLGQGFGGRSLCLSERTLPELPFEMQVEVKLGEESGAAGLVFRADGGDKHYGFYPSSGKLRLSRFEGPDVFAWSVLQEKDVPAYRSGEWNTIKVRLEADQFKTYVNDQLVFESRDAAFTTGKVGLAKFRDTSAEFKGFLVAPQIPPSNLPPAEVERVRQIVSTIPSRELDTPATIQKLLPEGKAGIKLLRERSQQLEREMQQLKRLATDVHEEQVRRDLVTSLSGKEEEIDLARAALLISKLDNEDLEIEAYLKALDRHAETLKATLPADAAPAVKQEALRKFLFEDQGYHGSHGDFENRSNSYLNEVIDDREGLPITLSVVYLEMARRIGLEARGIGLPSHFVVEVAPYAKPPQFVDVFNGGKVITLAEAQLLVFENTSKPLDEEFLQPITKRAIIRRMLNNLQSHARGKQDGVMLLRYVEALVELDPESPEDRWLRAVLRFQTDRIEAARQDVEWLLDRQPREIDLERVRELGILLDRRRIPE